MHAPARFICQMERLPLRVEITAAKAGSSAGMENCCIYSTIIRLENNLVCIHLFMHTYIHTCLTSSLPLSPGVYRYPLIL